MATKIIFQNLLNKSTSKLSLKYKHYTLLVRYIKYQVTHSCDIYVVLAFTLFITMQLVLWPIYWVLYLIMLVTNSYRIYCYRFGLHETEVSSTQEFYQSQYVWLEFIYNITYRRACVNSFSILYKVLKLFKGSNSSHLGVFRKIITYVKVLLHVLSIILWNLTTGIPWFIVSRAFQYSKAFRFLRDESPLDPLIMRQLVLNNYQMDELLPGLNYRIYKTDNSIWNFNPHVLKNPKASTVLFNKA